jgi:ribosome-binding factor A
MGIRPDRIASLIQRELAPILSEAGKQILNGGFLTLMEVEISADLGVAKAYISIYNSEDTEADLKLVQDFTPQIKKYLTSQIRNQMKKMPELRIYLDESQNRSERMDELLKKIKGPDSKQ